MNLENIQTFLKIIKNKSISKTADELFVSQSTISHRLKTLEDEIGILLVQRNRGEKNISLTNAGEEFIELAHKWVALEEETKLFGKANRRLKIGCSDCVSACVLPDFCRQLLMNDTDKIFKLHTSWTDTIIDQIRERVLDIGLVLKKREESELIFQPIFSEKLVVLSNIKELAHKHLDLSTLPLDKVLYFDCCNEFSIWYDKRFSLTDESVLKVDTVSSFQSIFSLRECWSIVPISIAKRIAKYEEISMMEIVDDAPERVCYIAKQRYPRKTAIGTIEFFERQLEAYLEKNSFSDMVSCNKIE